MSRTAKQDRLILGLALLAAILHGWIYIFLMPPWQHYDEPNHFEYVWLAANLDRPPVPEDYNPKLSRQVLKSMLARGFFDHLEYKPVIGPPVEKVKLPGYSQLAEPPLYYWLASLPARLAAERGVTAQLYAARLVSLLLLAMTVLASWAIAGELTQAGHSLRWMLPVTVAMTPAFVDLMTAVNNDSLAIAVASFFLWMSVRLIRRGFDWLGFFGLTLLGLVTYFVKNTAMLALVVYPVALLFSLLRGRWRKLVWAMLALSLSAGLAVSLRWDDAFAWYRNTAQAAAIRQVSDQAAHGSHVFALNVGARSAGRRQSLVFQNLPVEISKELAGKWVTFGYWIWSDQEIRTRSPILKTTGKPISEQISLTPEPVFYAFQALLPADTDRIWIYLSPDAPESGSLHIQYDGLVLAEGRRPVTELPQFEQADGSQGQWGGQPFQNLIRNGSAERAGLRFSAGMDSLGARFLPDHARPSLLLASLFDTQGSQDVYPVTLKHLFRTFWAQFGWGHVPLVAESGYQILFLLTIASLVGALLGALRAGWRAPWDVIFTLALGVLVAFLLTLTRGGTYLEWSGFYIAPARHIDPFVIPLLLLFCSGWLELVLLVAKFWLKLTRRQSVEWKSGFTPALDKASRLLGSLYIVGFLGLDMFSIISIARYYGYL